MKIYDIATGYIIEVISPDSFNEKGYKNWEQAVFDNQPNKTSNLRTGLLFTFDPIPTCEMKYRKLSFSDISDSRIGNYKQYGIGSIVEMTQAEKDVVDYVPTPISDYEQKRQSNIAFGQKLLKTIVETGNSQGFSSEVSAKINQYLLNASDLMTHYLKGFIDSGRADIEALPITDFFPQLFKDFILQEIQNGFTNQEWFVLPQN